MRFRAQGRDPAFGLDCVGLAATALVAGGYRGAVPGGYALRTAGVDGIPDGLVACDGASAGDVLLCRAGPGQVHLAVWMGDGIVHADAGLRRVVERPGPAPWPVIAAWRIDGGETPWRH